MGAARQLRGSELAASVPGEEGPPLDGVTGIHSLMDNVEFFGKLFCINI